MVTDDSGAREYTVAVGGPKGGVGKSSIVCCVSAILARYAPASRVLAVDAAVDNHNTLLYLEACEQYLPNVDVGQADDPDTLRAIRSMRGTHRFKLIDLPGGLKSGELEAVLHGDGDNHGADLLVIPTGPSAFDVASLLPAVLDVIKPSGIPYGVVLSKVPPRALAEAADLQSQLEAADVEVFRTVVRDYRGVRDAQRDGKPITVYGGRHDHVRYAEDDYRSLTREVCKRIGARVRIPTRSDEYEEARRRGQD
jgi:chromosome partitioning protein